MRGGSQEATWRGWVQALPAELVRARPVLSVYYAFALLPAELDAADALPARRRTVAAADGGPSWAIASPGG